MEEDRRGWRKRAVEARGMKGEEKRSGAGKEEWRRNERESEREITQVRRNRIGGREEYRSGVEADRKGIEERSSVEEE